MITAESGFVAIGDSVEKRIISFKGLSRDVKPTETFQGMTIQNGSSFFEMDTLKVKFFDADSNTWVPEEG